MYQVQSPNPKSQLVFFGKYPVLIRIVVAGALACALLHLPTKQNLGRVYGGYTHEHQHTHQRSPKNAPEVGRPNLVPQSTAYALPTRAVTSLPST